VVPFQSPLEHLEALILRIADLVTAHFARLPAESYSRRMDREAFLASAGSFGQGETPERTHRHWDAAAKKLTWIRQRELISMIDLPFRRLADTFGLSQVEQDVVILVAAPKIDPRYESHFRALESEFVDPWVRTVISILSKSFEESIRMRKIFSQTAPLFANSILMAEVRGRGEGDFLSVDLEVPRRIVGEMLGESHVAEELVAFSRLRTATISLDQVVLPAEQKDLVLSLVKNHDAFLVRRKQWGLDDLLSYGKSLVMLFAGPPGTGKTMLADAVAATLGKRLFCVDSAKLSELGKSLESNLDSVFREARLLDAVLFFDECEQIFSSREQGNWAMPTLLTRLEQFDGVAILATNMEEVLDEALARRIIAKIDFKPPSATARAAIWQRHLPPKLPCQNDVDLEKLAEGFQLTGGYIKNAVLAAVVNAVSHGSDSVSMADLEHGARLQLRLNVDEQRRVERPEARLEDLVLPEDLRRRIQQFVDSARAQSTVLTEWGLGKTLGQCRALTALFCGDPGTGKTMAAEAIATALECPILRCPLSSVISKYVGETAKNISKLFQLAKEHRAVLVFDEADALFARRVAVHTANDRFANAETGTLLTEIERHEGVVILTTNLTEHLDVAFERRLQLHLTFPLPDIRARLALWRGMLGSETPLASDVDFPMLARSFELAGGHIRNAVMAAALEAATLPAGQRKISQAMLERGAAEQLKMPVESYRSGTVGSA
jgi:SpoVK/Ycf46/Vps4 family AAA+-type ATPase